MNPSQPYIDTANIGALRLMLKKLEAMSFRLGEIIQFEVVIDANRVIGDLIQKAKHPERGTAVEELIKATVLTVHAPYWLEQEMASAIPQTSRKRKLPEEKLWEAWREYRTALQWHQSSRAIDPEPTSCVDPKDLPYVELERRLRTCGILTADHHIKAMGGHPLSLDFVFAARGYARAVLPAVGIKVFGVMVPAVTVTVLIQAMTGLSRRASQLSTPTKVLLSTAAILALLHPRSRGWIGKRLIDLGEYAIPVFLGFQEVITHLATFHTTSQTQADQFLAKTRAMTRSQPFPPRSRRVRPRKSRSPAAGGAPQLSCTQPTS
jgi:predicted nucleic acid-binding protein